MMLRRLKDVLWALVFIAGLALIVRFTQGLGAATSLSDEMPWGIWKVLNMVAGVALSTGGFAFAAAVHILRIRRLQPLLRPALLVACLGYACSCAALFVDIGLPMRIWHPLVHWNAHSFLFEVAWCVMIYLSVALVEVSPIALEGSKHAWILKVLRAISPPLIILGITLSTLHHTTLGSLFLVSPGRLHALWYTPGLPVHFFLSALGAGIMSLILVTLVVSRLYRSGLAVRAVRPAAVVAGVVLSLYFVTKVVDLVRRGAVDLLAVPQWETALYAAELLLGVLVPIVLVMVPRFRRSNRLLGAAAALTVAGLLLNRLDVGILGFLRSSGATYTPSFAEIAISLGIPAGAGLVFLYCVERFRVFTAEGEPVALMSPETAGVPVVRRLRPAFVRLSFVFVVSASLAAGFFPVASASDSALGPHVHRPLQVGDEPGRLIIDGDRDGDAVFFPHDVHAEMLGGKESCLSCHHLNGWSDEVSSCSRCHARMHEHQPVFNHDRHLSMVASRNGFGGPRAENRTCALCHDPDSPRPEVDPDVCSRCHAEPGWEEIDGGDHMRGYVSAIHGSCMRCHGVREKGKITGAKLGHCDYCHQ